VRDAAASRIREQSPRFDFDFVQMRGRDSSGKIQNLDPDDHSSAPVIEDHTGRDLLAFRHGTFAEREMQSISLAVDAQLHEMLRRSHAAALAAQLTEVINHTDMECNPCLRTKNMECISFII